jgi:hypothetical protein
MLKIITLGLNPSRAEFPKEDRFLRFSKVRNIYPDVLEVGLLSQAAQPALPIMVQLIVCCADLE